MGNISVQISFRLLDRDLGKGRLHFQRLLERQKRKVKEKGNVVSSMTRARSRPGKIKINKKGGECVV
jgi:hypothetical protein